MWGSRFFLLTRNRHIPKDSEPLNEVTHVATLDSMKTTACWTCLCKRAATSPRCWATPSSHLKEEASITLPGGTINGYARYTHGHRTETTQVGRQFSSPHLKFHCQPDVSSICNRKERANIRGFSCICFSYSSDSRDLLVRTVMKHGMLEKVTIY